LLLCTFLAILSSQAHAAYADNGDGTVTTIEGNTSPEKKPTGSQANGGEVAERIRAYKANNKRKLGVYIVGFGRPKWSK
jgi:hypothetical protein